MIFLQNSYEIYDIYRKFFLRNFLNQSRDKIKKGR
jgi:hypothetical protein